MPTDGAVPLSTTLDTVSAITRSVRDAVVLHEILADRRVALAGRPLRARRFAVPTTSMLDGLDPTVARAFERSLGALCAARRADRRDRARAARRARRDQRRRRLSRRRKLGLAPPLAGEPRGRVRPARRPPHPARRGDERRRLHRPDRRAPRLDRAHGERAARLRRPAVADRAHGRAAARAAGRRRRRVLRHQRAPAAQPVHRQLARRLRAQRCRATSPASCRSG